MWMPGPAGIVRSVIIVVCLGRECVDRMHMWEPGQTAYTDLRLFGQFVSNLLVLVSMAHPGQTCTIERIVYLPSGGGYQSR